MREVNDWKTVNKEITKLNEHIEKEVEGDYWDKQNRWINENLTDSVCEHIVNPSKDQIEYIKNEMEERSKKEFDQINEIP